VAMGMVSFEYVEITGRRGTDVQLEFRPPPGVDRKPVRAWLPVRRIIVRSDRRNALIPRELAEADDALRGLLAEAGTAQQAKTKAPSTGD